MNGSPQSRASQLVVALFTAVLFSVVGGCVTTRLAVPALPSSADPSIEISNLSREIDHARAESLAALSPDWFSKAQESLADARRRHDQSRGSAEVLGSVARGRAQLDKAFQSAELAGNVLAKPIDARQAARVSGATEYEAAYADIERSFLELTRAVESGDIDWAKRRSGDVASAYGSLELRAIKEKIVSDIGRQIGQARADGAAQYAPVTLSETQRKLSDLEAFITAQRYARAEMNERAAAVLADAKRLVHITRRARAVSASNPELVVLEEGANLARLAKGLSLPDLRDRTFEKRWRGVENAIFELRNDRDFLVEKNRQSRAELAQLRVNLAALEGKSAEESARLERLEDERRFARVYDEVSAYFAPEEAKVYKQSDRLVLRLRGLSFPVGTATFSAESYGLLAKVQKSIRAFGESSVTVEGHTDDTGPAALNEHLSQQRAEAVKAYLVSNNVLPSERITAVGKGFSDPLASNKSAEGRAVNRRIDVIIEPAVAAR